MAASKSDSEMSDIYDVAVDTANDETDSDIIMIDEDDISNYNPDHILPQPPETIKTIRKWLKPTEYDAKSGEYGKHLGSYVPGTGSWVTSSQTYQQWLNGQKHGLLWIKGIPGSGKSVLSAKLVNDLSKSHPGVPILYFFFRQIIDANHSPEALLRDWMDQILVYSPPLQQRLKEVTSSYRSQDTPSMEDLWKMLRIAMNGLPGQIFCVADALDEMDGGNDSFLQALAALGRWKPDKIKVIMTSRPVPSVEVPLRKAKCLQLRLEEKLVDVDIASYVDYVLQDTSIAPNDRQLIKNAVPGNANGLFLYAKFAMDTFLEPGADIQEALRLLPTDLNAIYTNLLAEHARRSGVPGDIQLLILQWVTHATRPLRLIEMAEMINITYRAEADRNLKTAKDLVRAACGPLLEILPDETVSVVHHSFTEYLKGMTRSAESGGYPILQSGPTNARLAMACLSYMRAGCLDEIFIPKTEPAKTPHATGDLPSTDDRYESDEDYDDVGDGSEHRDEHFQMKLKHPFFRYATSNWYVHATRSSKAGCDQTTVDSAIDDLLRSGHRRRAWLKYQWPDAENVETTRGVTALHIAATYGLATYVKKLVEVQDFEVDGCDTLGRTPLWWAAYHGHAEVIRILIEAGANPNHAKEERGLKPLHKAAGSNHFEAVKVLLEAGVDPLTEKSREDPGRRCGNAPGTKGHTALMYACESGYTETVDIFLPFLKDMTFVYKALRWASVCGHAKTVHRILQYPGLDVNRKTRGETALFSACEANDYDTIKVLLDAGADPNIRCLSDRSEFSGMWRAIALPSSDDEPIDFSGFPHHDSKSGSSEDSSIGGDDHNTKSFHKRAFTPPEDRGLTAIQRLCGITDRSYRRPSHWYRDSHHQFSLLVEAGADILQSTGRGETLLHYTALNNSVLTRLLLDTGADARARDHHGSTPLHNTENMDCLSLLIELGHADINARSKDLITPLFQIATRGSGCMDTLAKFLEYGPDCNAVDQYGNSVLHELMGASSVEPEHVKALLEAGADPNLKNHLGESPLHRLARVRRIAGDILPILLEAGSDVDIRDNRGRTALFNIHPDHIRMDLEKLQQAFKCLLAHGASKDVRDFQGRSILHEVIKNCDKSCTTRDITHTNYLNFLLDIGLDSQVVDHNGNNLLHELALLWRKGHGYSNDLSMWHRLLTLGLSPNQRNHAGRTPLHIFVECQLHRDGSLSQNLEAMALIVDTTKSIDAADLDGMTPLHLAAISSESYTKRLLDAGADPTISSFEGLAPLHLAARARQSNIVAMLLDALQFHSSRTGETLPTTSETHVSNGNDSSMSGLLHLRPTRWDQVSSWVNAKDSHGWTPLSHACLSGRPETVSLLLQAGAAVDLDQNFLACAGFEDEADCWMLYQVNQANRATDGSNPSESAYRGMSAPWLRPCSEPPRISKPFEPNADTARLEEILEMLARSVAQTPAVASGVDDDRSRTTVIPRILSHSMRKKHDYTAECFYRLLEQSGNRTAGKSSNPTRNFDRHANKYRRGKASAKALMEFKDIKSLQGQPEFLYSILRRREFHMIEDISRSGIDFLAAKHCPEPSSFLHDLIKYGYANLVDKIGSHEMEVKFGEGTWHAANDSTRPGLGHCTQPPTEDAYGRIRCPKTFLQEAIDRDLPNMEVVRLLVEKFGVDVNEFQFNYQRVDRETKLVPWMTALHRLAKGQSWWHVAQAMPYLIEHHADLNSRTYDDKTPLHIALAEMTQDPKPFTKDAIRVLVAAGADIHAQDGRGWSCLAYAGQDVEITRLLLSQGANVRAEDIFFAIDGNQVEVLEELLQAGGNPNGRPEKTPERIAQHASAARSNRWWSLYASLAIYEWCPIYYAAMRHAGNPSLFAEWYPRNNYSRHSRAKCGILMQRLLQRGADPFATFWKAMHPAYFRRWKKQLGDKPRSMASSDAMDVDTTSQEHHGHRQCTVLHEILVNGGPVTPFLELPNLDPNHRDTDGRTVLLAACQVGRRPDQSFNTPDEASEKQDKTTTLLSVLLRLLSLGADPLARDNLDHNALHLLAQVPEFSEGRGGVETGAQEQESALAYMAKTYPTLLNDRNADGNTPLHLPLESDTDCLLSNAITLLENGADPRLVGKSGDTALHMTVQRLHDRRKRELFQKLLSHGLDINARNDAGETPLARFFSGESDWEDEDPDLEMSHKLSKEDMEAIEFLQTIKADFNTQDNQGRGLLHVAAKGDVARFKYLMDMGLDPMLEDDGQQTAVDVASACGNTWVLSLFERKSK